MSDGYHRRRCEVSRVARWFVAYVSAKGRRYFYHTLLLVCTAGPEACDRVGPQYGRPRWIPVCVYDKSRSTFYVHRGNNLIVVDLTHQLFSRGTAGVDGARTDSSSHALSVPRSARVAGRVEEPCDEERCGCFGKQSGRGNPLAPPPFRRCEMQRHVMPGQNEKEKTDACADTTSGDWQLSVSGVIWRSPFIPSACSKLEEDSTCQIRKRGYQTDKQVGLYPVTGSHVLRAPAFIATTPYRLVEGKKSS
ncbi:hypothetical protein B296_00033590 [Ensete ventricosum]|uniref:Uncharacterized protein n=1 Tax=Ensete ventricosum TaxID=4639 RepID=A0A426ZYD2_ENSVE|nr:hypothetical protein B296_00033590 [Ensete ventricosum]